MSLRVEDPRLLPLARPISPPCMPLKSWPCPIRISPSAIEPTGLCGRPPQGLLVNAASVPPGWQVRFVDENIDPASSEDFAWADAVFVSGMHVQRHKMIDICRRAHAVGKPAVLGGPSVSASPALYAEFDYLHIGEIGDATAALFA